MATISKIIGKVDGKAITFYRDGSNWAAAVPKDISDGEYILEVTVYDEAGNTAYSTGMYFIVDLRSLKVEIRPFNFATKEAQELYNILQPKGAPFSAVELAENFLAEVQPENFTYRTVIQ